MKKLFLIISLFVIFNPSKTFTLTILNHTTKNILLIFPETGIAGLDASSEPNTATKLTVNRPGIMMPILKRASIMVGNTRYIPNPRTMSSFSSEIQAVEIAVYQTNTGILFLRFFLDSSLEVDIPLLQEQPLPQESY